MFKIKKTYKKTENQDWSDIHVNINNCQYYFFDPRDLQFKTPNISNSELFIREYIDDNTLVFTYSFDDKNMAFKFFRRNMVQKKTMRYTISLNAYEDDKEIIII